MTDPNIRRIAAQLAKVQRDVLTLQTAPRAGQTSIEYGGSIDEYDPTTGELLSRTGTQHDGTHGAQILSGPTPAVPTKPTVVAGPGGLAVTWDGRLVDAFGLFIPQPLDLEGVEIFAAMGEDPTSDVVYRVGGIVATGGGTKAITPLDAGTWHVALRSRTVPGKTSALTPVVVVEVVAPVDPEIVWEVEAARELAEAAQAAATEAAGAADTARETAEAAQAAAAAAAGVAAGKGDVLIQSVAPIEAMRKASTLWIDTTGGANTPKRWSGSAWVAVTDKAATDAATAAANAATAAASAATAAGTAQGRADDAHDVATAAGLAATGAQTTANGKNRVTYSTAIPTAGLGTAPGDLWFRLSGSTVIAMYEFTGGAWVSRTLANAVIATLDAAKITTGLLNADRIAAGSVTAVKINIEDLTAAAAFIQRVRALGIQITNEAGEVVVNLTGAGEQALTILDDTGKTAVALDSMGRISGKSVSAETILLAGRDLTSLISSLAGSVVVIGGWNSAWGAMANISSDYGLFEVAFTAKAGRVYRIYADVMGNTSTNAQVVPQLRFTTNGSVPRITSTLLKGAGKSALVGKWDTHTLDVAAVQFSSVADTTVRLLLAVGCDAGTFTARDGRIIVSDAGAWIDNSAIVSVRNDGGGTAAPPVVVPPPAPPKQSYTQTFWSVGWRSFLGNGSINSGAAGAMQGYTTYYPGGGLQTSHIYFDSAAIRAFMSGGTVDGVTGIIKTPHWHSAAGGTLRIHGHNYDAHAGSPGTFTYFGDVGFGRGEEKAVGLGVGFGNGLRDGNYRGIGFNPSGSNSSQYYGYVDPGACRLVITVTK